MTTLGITVLAVSALFVGGSALDFVACARRRWQVALRLSRALALGGPVGGDMSDLMMRSEWVLAAGVAAFLVALAPVSVHATGVALESCHPAPEQEREMVTGFAAALKAALAKNDRRRLRNFLSDPVLVRLDGRKQSIHWETVDERFDEVFGPRVRAAVDEGRLTHGRSGWKLGKSVVFLGLAQHGAACGLEVFSVFEEPPPTK